jgi:hypothetical protein
MHDVIACPRHRLKARLAEEGAQHASIEDARTAESCIFGGAMVKSAATARVNYSALSDDSGF